VATLEKKTFHRETGCPAEGSGKRKYRAKGSQRRGTYEKAASAKAGIDLKTRKPAQPVKHLEGNRRPEK